MSINPILLILFAIALLLFLVLRLKWQAFIALLVVSMMTGLVAGMPVETVLKSMQEGMGGTLGFIAVVVGLGAIFGKILEESGGAEALAHVLLGAFGRERAPWALTLAGFLIAIPVFLDVGFIILVPVVYALSKESGRPLLYYAIPLLAGLAVTHTFVPPTPGPVAVADILEADLGWVILMGIVCGLPVAVLAGPVFGSFISRRIRTVENPLEALTPPEDIPPPATGKLPSFGLVVLLIGLPILLILLNTVSGVLLREGMLADGFWIDLFTFLGHPFTALTIATLLALYFLGSRRGYTRDQLLKFSTDALAPAGVIILITGAGGVFKQVLVDSGIGKALAETIVDTGIPPLILGYVLAVIIRVSQGSATVAMITAAGLLAPILPAFEPTEIEKALVVIAIAAGATILSHVNDSGFWLVGKYLGLTEKQTLQSWTVMETIVSVAGLATVLLMWAIVG